MATTAAHPIAENPQIFMKRYEKFLHASIQCEKHIETFDALGWH